MNRRANYSIFMQDEIIRKTDEWQKLSLWDVLQLFFPYDTNRKQLECANKLMRKLLEEKELDSTAMGSLLEDADYRAVVHVVIPKLESFGLLKVNGQRGRGKSYKLELSDKFSDRLRHIGMQWFRIYSKYGDPYGG